jgi:hypothetical protein
MCPILATKIPYFRYKCASHRVRLSDQDFRIWIGTYRDRVTPSKMPNSANILIRFGQMQLLDSILQNFRAPAVILHQCLAFDKNVSDNVTNVVTCHQWRIREGTPRPHISPIGSTHNLFHLWRAAQLAIELGSSVEY